MKAFSLNSVSLERNKNIYSGILFGASVFAFTALTVSFIAPNIGVDAATQTAEQIVGPHTMSMSNDSAATIDIIPTNTQTTYNVANNLTVSNTCSAGTTITIKTGRESNALIRPATSGDTLTKEIPATTSAFLDNSSWGYSLDNGTTWGAVPNSNDTAAIVYDGTAVASNITIPVMFGVKTDSSLPSGAYVNDIIYTMTPKDGCLSYSVTWDFNGGNAKAGATYPSTLNWGQTIDFSTLTPTRDGYTFTGWSVGSSTYASEETSADLNPTNEQLVAITANWKAICTVSAGTIYNFNYTGAMQRFATPCDGYYTVELWGAQGGNTGGKGGYTIGTINLAEKNNIYVYVGGAGLTSVKNTVSPRDGGWNGGGAIGGQNCCNRIWGSGGGATDIRFFGINYSPSSSELAWNSTLGLNSRIMVAAGGGGRFTDDSVSSAGGNGGGLTGGNATGEYTAYCPGTGATQTSGGMISTNSANYCIAGTYPDYTSPGLVNGSFGQGGSHGNEGNTSTGGGGGYYGGGSSGHIASAGGGSSYISGLTGAVAITSSTNRSPKSGCATGTTSNDCSIHYSGLKFTNASTTAGQRSGNGYARITYLGETI